MTTRVARQVSVWRVFGRWESEITRDTLKGRIPAKNEKDRWISERGDRGR